jgi:hypothetical protein
MLLCGMTHSEQSWASKPSRFRTREQVGANHMIEQTLSIRTRLGNTVELSNSADDPGYVRVAYIDNNNGELASFPIEESELVHFLEMLGYRVAKKEFDYIR